MKTLLMLLALDISDRLGKPQHTLTKPTSCQHFLFRACGCDAVVYDQANFGGRSLLIRQQNARFHNDFFNDKMESLKIYGSCSYLFYEHKNFLGSSFLLRPGSYASPQTWGGSGNYISSARALPPKGTTAIMLFEHSDYRGRMVTLYSSHDDMPFLDFNDKISSIIVIGGYWTVYEHTEYRGHSQRIGPGHYPDPVLGNDKISSISLY